MAKAKRKRKARAERLHREPIVRRVADVLLTGEPTRWRWVSACRHGIRAALCELGYRNGNPKISPWEQADQLAEAIVTSARHRIGISLYPTWSDAKGAAPEEREYWFCQGCGGFMQSNGRPWCSEECRHVVRGRRYQASGRRDENARLHAVRIALTGGAEPAQRRCKHCDQLIAPTMHVTVYCSSRCRELAHEKPSPRQCKICEKTFQPFNSLGLFCSDSCSDEGERRAQRVRRGLSAEPAKTCCKVCSATFMPRAQSQLTCSDACRAEMARRRAAAHHEAKKLRSAAVSHQATDLAEAA